MTTAARLSPIFEKKTDPRPCFHYAGCATAATCVLLLREVVKRRTAGITESLVVVFLCNVLD